MLYLFWRYCRFPCPTKAPFHYSTDRTVPWSARRRAGRGIMIGTLFLFFPLLWHDTILLNDDSSAVTHRSNARPRGRRERERETTSVSGKTLGKNWQFVNPKGAIMCRFDLIASSLLLHTGVPLLSDPSHLVFGGGGGGGKGGGRKDLWNILLKSSPKTL